MPCVLIEDKEGAGLCLSATRAQSSVGFKPELRDPRLHRIAIKVLAIRLVKETAEALREDFSRDGAAFICNTWIRDADEVFLPAINANRIKRYLYHIHV